MKTTMAVAGLIVAAGAAMGQTVEFDNPGAGFRFGNGGAFIAFVEGIQDVSDGSFITFCIELDETLNFSQTFDVAVNTVAVQGGAGGPDPDPLSSESAYIYQAFRTGTFTTAGLQSAAAGALSQAMQVALWLFEDEIVRDGVTNSYLRSDDLSLVGTTNGIVQGLVDLLLAEAADAIQNGFTGLGSVRVLNLTRGTGDNTVQHQDVLVLIPLPQTAALATAGLGLIAVRRRRAL